MSTTSDIIKRITPGRKIAGVCAVFLPLNAEDKIDLNSFMRLLNQVILSDLTPAINLDSGFVNHLTYQEKSDVLLCAHEVLSNKPFFAGATIEGEIGDAITLYSREAEIIQKHGGTPILLQSSALHGKPDRVIVEIYKQIAANCESVIAAETGQMFAPYGQIYSLGLVEELMQIPQLAGLHHASLRRDLEWMRLDLRDRIRPDFKIYTGNELALDMVMYGSDYLLGLPVFAPELFSIRDAHWANNDQAFFELNDKLQALGSFAYRHPVPAYKHTTAQFLKLIGAIETDHTHPDDFLRTISDCDVLRGIAERLNLIK